MEKSPITPFRWLLRILSGLLILFVLYMFIGETFFPPESMNAKPMTRDSIIQLTLMVISVIGLGLAWKWELVGGVISLIAYIFLAAVNAGARQFSLLLLIPAIAVLYIILWSVSRKRKQTIEDI